MRSTSKPGAEFLVASLENLELGDRRFDKIFAVRVGLFHRDPERARGIVERWLAPGGSVFAFFDPPPARSISQIQGIPQPVDSGTVDLRLELIQVPVSDVDRAKAFYTEMAGFNEDVDITVSDEIRFVQLTPPGSPASIAIGRGLTEMAPGSVQGMQLVVDDIEEARADLVERGVDVSEVQVFDWGSFVFFSDPDGNGWSVQQLPVRD